MNDRKDKIEMFKLFRKNKKNSRIIIIVSVLGISTIICTIFLTRTFSKEKQSFNIIKGQMSVQQYVNNGDYKEKDFTSWNFKKNMKYNIEFMQNLSTEEYNKYIKAGIALRRNTYRGKDITAYYNDGSLYEMISKGTFDDIYVGDYIVANNVTWLIADIDNYLNSGDTPLTKHHITIIPAIPLMNKGMNATNTTEGGYINTRMVTETLPSLISEEGVIGKTFGSHIIEYRNVLSNRVDIEAVNQSGGKWTGASDEWNWYSRKIDLMSEVNVYGTTVWSSSGYDIGIDNKQYALFQLKPEYINSYRNTRFSSWLKAVSGATKFAFLPSHGQSGNDWGEASYEVGVRPRFLVG